MEVYPVYLNPEMWKGLMFIYVIILSSVFSCVQKWCAGLTQVLENGINKLSAVSAYSCKIPCDHFRDSGPYEITASILTFQKTLNGKLSYCEHHAIAGF